ncbi:MAG TPA: serine/threonine-protein kinase [Kofleriaceae bacterium]|nr:serine/threonine-protein kinase [Kofleriaceae bacterium]
MTAVPAVPAFQPDEVVEGRYRILRMLADGGMGTVYLAEHVLIKRRLAIKVLHAELAGDRAMVQRFMNEASAAGTLGHPHIVESTDMGFTPGGLPFIVFEYLEGCVLTEEVYRTGGMPVRRALQIASQIASALQAAHDARIVHLDLKSDNVFLIDRGAALDHAKVLDFGIARFMEATPDKTQRGLIMGTPEFMAPEQITAPDRVDARADIYALGVLLYEMIAARRPYAHDDPRVLLHRIVHVAPPPLDKPVPAALEHLLFDRMLAKSPDDRIQTMQEVEAALETIMIELRAESSGAIRLATRPVELPPPAPVRRKPRLVWPVAAIMVGLTSGALGYAESDPALPGDAAALIARDADTVAAMLDGEIRAARARLEALTSAPMLRAAVETDAATVADMVSDGQLIKPRAGETIELVQAGRRHARLLRLPADADAPSLITDTPTRLAAYGSQLVLTVTAPVATQRGAPGGTLASAAPIDLSLVARQLAGHARGAQLRGLAHPIPIGPTGDGAELSAPVKLDGLAAPLTLAARVPLVVPHSLGPVRTASLAIAGLLLAIYAAGWMRYRRAA